MTLLQPSFASQSLGVRSRSHISKTSAFMGDRWRLSRVTPPEPQIIILLKKILPWKNSKGVALRPQRSFKVMVA